MALRSADHGGANLYGSGHHPLQAEKTKFHLLHRLHMLRR